MRLGVERLEDRVIPGETLNAILFWQMGLFPVRELLGTQGVADEGWSLVDTRPDHPVDAGAGVRGDDAIWTPWVPFSVLASGGEVTTSAPNCAPQDIQDTSDSSRDVRSDSLLWSTDLTQPVVPHESAAESAGPISNGAAVPSPSAWAPPVIDASAANSVTGAEVVPIAPESAIQVSPAASEAGATPMLHAQPAGNPHGGGGPAGYTPAQMRHAYGFDALANYGAQQTIAIVDAFDAPNVVSDLDTFSRQFGLPTTTSGLFTFSKAYAQGAKPNADGSWAQEASLDVEWAHAIAPRANIMLVETASASAGNLFGGVDYAVGHGAHVVSMSWGFNDSLLGSAELGLDSHFQVSGVTFLASSGDFGGQVYYPSASPYVVSVGGTRLPLDAAGNLTSSETAWSSGGGGASVVEPEPVYQSTYGISLSGRGTPDVSYNADPNTGVAVFDSYPYRDMSGWLVAGGTSAGAPQWAGLVALVNQGRTTPLTGVDLSESTSPFYTAATGAVYSSNYRDIIAGSNHYNATIGYDLATGVGSPLAASLVPFLIALPQ
jgi:hypothetical protein